MLVRSIVLMAMMALVGEGVSEAKTIPVGEPCPITWDANTEPDLARYRLYWDRGNDGFFEVVTLQNIPQTSCDAVGIRGPGNYTIFVTAVDFSGNESGPSNEVMLTRVWAFPIQINFQPSSPTIPDGYVPEYGMPYDPNVGYGWFPDTLSFGARDRNSHSDQRLDTFWFAHHALWRLDLPNGTYQVSLASGDPGFPRTIELVVQGETVLDQVSVHANEFALLVDHPVTVTDGTLMIELSPNGTGRQGENLLTMLNYLTVDHAGFLNGSIANVNLSLEVIQ